jgi:hypothetical protein
MEARQAAAGRRDAERQAQQRASCPEVHRDGFGRAVSSVVLGIVGPVAGRPLVSGLPE